MRSIVTGTQIRAARELLGWRRQDLARAAGLHPNAVAYWERRKFIPSPPACDAPVACRRIRSALMKAGVLMVDKPGPGVAQFRETAEPAPVHGTQFRPSSPIDFD